MFDQSGRHDNQLQAELANVRFNCLVDLRPCAHVHAPTNFEGLDKDASIGTGAVQITAMLTQCLAKARPRDASRGPVAVCLSCWGSVRG